MELAKIRNKARQASTATEMQGAVQLEPTASAVQEETVLPAQPLTDDLFVQHSELGLPLGPVPVSPGIAAQRFDPLAVILSGRERDREGGRVREEHVEHELQLAAPEQEYEEFLCFRLGSEEYGVNIMEIKEIIKPRELTDVPRMPQYVDGVLSLRGVIVPVFTMRRRLAMSMEYDRSQERIIIVRCDDGLHGLRVDRVTDVVRISNEHREATPAVLEGVAREFVAGIGRSGNRMVIILDITKVIDTALGEGY